MTRHQHFRLSVLTALVLGATAVWTAYSDAQTQGAREHFTANAVDLNSGQTGRIEILVSRWSTTAERAALIQTLFKKGPDALLEAVRDSRAVGRIYTPGSIGYELRFAHQQPLPEGGREIILATDRPMSFRELTRQQRSADYPFTWVQLQMKPDGTGEGQLAVAARITGEEADQRIEVETFAIQPVRLQSVQVRRANN